MAWLPDTKLRFQDWHIYFLLLSCFQIVIIETNGTGYSVKRGWCRSPTTLGELNVHGGEFLQVLSPKLLLFRYHTEGTQKTFLAASSQSKVNPSSLIFSISFWSEMSQTSQTIEFDWDCWILFLLNVIIVMFKFFWRILSCRIELWSWICFE